MELVKLLPLLFVAARGDARAIEHPQQLLPVIPGYVPVYIQQGPDVEVIYETGRKATTSAHDPKAAEPTKAGEGAEGQSPPGGAPEKVAEEAVKEEGEEAAAEKEATPAPTAVPPPAGQQPSEGERKDDRSRAIGTVEEIGGYRVRR